MLLFLALLAVHASAQQGTGAPRTPEPPGPATARLRGRVVAAETGAPIAQASVLISAGPSPIRKGTVRTNAEGRWEFAMPATGQYLVTISASAPGYTTLSLGQHTLKDRIRRLQVHDNEVIDRLDLALPGRASLVVDVTDDFGEPIDHVTVAAERLTYSDGRRQPAVATVAITDDQGTARLSGLEPGDYFVSADYAANDRTPRLDTSDSRQTFAHTYVPGTSELRHAQRISVSPGSEQRLTVSLVRTSSVSVSGRVTTADGGLPPPHQLALRARSGHLAYGLGPRGFTIFVPATSDGSFTLANVPPGDYDLIATVVPTPPRPSLSPLGGAAAALPVPSIGPSFYGQVGISVAGSDIENLVVALQPMPVLRGRIRFAGAPPANVSPSSFVFVQRVFFSGDAIGTARTLVNDDWSFVVTGVAGTGALRLNPQPGAGGWFLERVTVEGRDITDEPVSFADLASKTIDVLVTNQPSEVSGVARDARGQPTGDYVAVIFPQDRRKWLPNSHVVDAATPDAQGEFRFTAITPGDYYVVAVDHLENLQEEDPAVLERLEPLATRFSLDGGEKKVLPLKVTTW